MRLYNMKEQIKSCYEFETNKKIKNIYNENVKYI